MSVEKEFNENKQFKNSTKKGNTDQIVRRIVGTRRTEADTGKENYDAIKLKDAQTMMLQMQINPHFLGNTLNVINWMAIEMTMCENPVSAAIGKLAKLFKTYSDATDFMTDFEEEIEFTNQYADILKLRYPDTFSIEWDVDERHLNARVPRIILQPLVENAIYHGIKPLDEKGSVKISSRVENNFFIISVEDSGKGMSDEGIRNINFELEKGEVPYNGHIGLKNVNQRLKLIYGNEFGIQMEKSFSGGLRVVIKIPYTYMATELSYKAKKNLSENSASSVKDTVERLLRRMMSQRKQKEVEYFPYVKPVGYKPNYPGFDFGKIYPDWETGDTAFVTANMVGSNDREMVISITGDNEIFFNDEKPESFECDHIGEAFKINGIRSYRVKFVEGDNLLVIKQKADSTHFKFDIYIGDESSPVSWPTEYNYKLRPVIPFGSMKDIEGFTFSKLYKNNEIIPEVSDENIVWAGPEAPEDVKRAEFDFNSMTTYNIASAVTKASGHILLRHTSPIRVYIDGEKVYSKDSGCYEGVAMEEVLLYVEADKTDSGFGFVAEDGCFSAPFYKSSRRDLSWIWLEGVHGIASNIQFTRPYVCRDGDRTFFKFLRKDTYMRPYLNTSFYGQWFYAIALGHYSLLKMAEIFDKQEYIDYFIDSVNVLCEYYDYAQYDKKLFGINQMLHASTRLNDIITVGPIGLIVCEYMRLTGRENGEYILNILKNALKSIPRSEKGIIHRPAHFAIDDLFMVVPFFARLGGKYMDDAIAQVKGLFEMLYIKEKKLFAHIYYTNEDHANQIPWARGNGWAMLAFSELLTYMPENHPDRDYILGIFREFTEGILDYQDEKGMWHLILDEPETFEESSSTGMFITAMTRGVKNGWLSRDIVPKLWRAWRRLTEICIDDDGNLLGICTGAGVYSKREGYRKMSACMNDDHGVGIIILAGAEMLDIQ